MNNEHTNSVFQSIRGFFGIMAGHPGSVLIDGPPGTCLITGIKHFQMNGIFRNALGGDEGDGAFEEALAPFLEREMPFIWWMSPPGSPADMADRLMKKGLSHGGDCAGMSLDLAGWRVEENSTTGVLLREVESRKALDDFTIPLGTAFELPDFVVDAFTGIADKVGYGAEKHWRHFIATVEGRPAASASLMLQGSIASIWNVATLPELRRRGIGTAVTAKALREAKRAGCTRAVLISSSMGLGAYKCLGFRECCTISQFIFDPASNHKTLH